MGILRIETGWCGIGAHGGLLPELRLGLVRLTVASGTFARELEETRVALRLAYTALQKLHENTKAQRVEITELRRASDDRQTAISQLSFELHQIKNPPRDAAGRYRGSEKSLDEICAERRERDALAARVRPRDGRTGQFVGVKI